MNWKISLHRFCRNGALKDARVSSGKTNSYATTATVWHQVECGMVWGGREFARRILSRSISAQIPIKHAQQSIPLDVIVGLITDRGRIHAFDRGDLFGHVGQYGLGKSHFEGGRC